jgi:D-alanyl-D-alanine carboxypeptidase/D-alanyl-D-alanine-endopeptidase (penicillin-binding protein 4)
VDGRNETLTAAADSGDGVVIHGGERTQVLHFRGTVPHGQARFQVQGAVPDPETFTAYHFREALIAAGIQVIGAAAPMEKQQPATAYELLKHHSPPLMEIITSIHATSDNHETECLFQTIALQTGMTPAESVRSHWEGRGLDLSGWRMVDGSGLARADFITPRALARLQYLASTGPQGSAYAGSLLTAFDGALRFKAGAMSAVRSITGLLETESGEILSFAFMVNHYSEAASVQRLQGELLGAMSAWGTELSVETPEEAEEVKTDECPAE